MKVGEFTKKMSVLTWKSLGFGSQTISFVFPLFPPAAVVDVDGMVLAHLHGPYSYVRTVERPLNISK